MSGPSGNYAAAAKVDQVEQTIWHAVASNEIVYFQHDLSDFSLIGSKYATNKSMNSVSIYDMSINSNFVFIL